MSEKKAEKTPKIEEIAKIVAEDPAKSTRRIASETGISKSEIARILKKPITRQRVAERLAADGTGGANRTIGQILSALGALADDMLEAGLANDNDITKFLQLLQALTGATERLGRAGIDLTALVDPTDDAALRHEIARAWRRGLAAGVRWPRAAKRRLGPHRGANAAE